MNWKRDKGWSDQFLTEIKSILGRHLISEPPIEEDQERNTDLMVLRLDAVRIGCRIRREKWMQYSGEFTIREGRPSGVKTELEKIVRGWGNYLFYGFGSDDGHLLRWKLADLNEFRVTVQRHMHANQGQLPGMKQRNGDGSSWFRAYQWADFPDEMIVAESHEVTPCL